MCFSLSTLLRVLLYAAFRPLFARAERRGVWLSLPLVSSPEVKAGVTPPVPLVTRLRPETVLLVLRWCSGIHSEGSDGVLGRGVGDLATTEVEADLFLIAFFLGKNFGSMKVLYAQ